MAKVQNIEKKTHCYLLENGAVIRAISAAHVDDYLKDKKPVYSCNASKMVDGVKTETVNYYVLIDDFVKRSASRQSLNSKLEAITSGIDLTNMTAAELLAQLKA